MGCDMSFCVRAEFRAAMVHLFLHCVWLCWAHVAQAFLTLCPMSGNWTVNDQVDLAG